MTIRFANAPLIEVITELRWNTTQDALFQQALPGTPIQFSDEMNAAAEAFFQRFAGHLDDHQFRSSERLFPYGTPLVPGQAAMRFRRRAGDPPLIQVGNGVLTANGLPPTYTHWDDFVPVVRLGVESMLAARDEAERAIPFNATIRYVDAFGPEYWADANAGRFITDVLGFSLSLPGGVERQLHTTKPFSVAHQLNLPLDDGSTLLVSVGEGFANNAPAVVLELVVQKSDIVPDTDAIMAQFRAGHDYIRELFVAMTSQVHSIMQPVDVSAP